MGGEGTRELQLPPSTPLSVWTWKGRLFYLSVPRFVSLMKSLLETGGYQKEQGGGVAAPLGRDAAQGNALDAKVRSGMVCVRIESNLLLSKHVLSHFAIFLMFMLLSLPFFYPFASDLSLSDLSAVAVKI